MKVLLMSLALAGASIAQTYDVVLTGGRAMDPESGLDAVRNVGIGPNPRIELVTGLSVPLARSKRRAFVDRLRSE